MEFSIALYFASLAVFTMAVFQFRFVSRLKKTGVSTEAEVVDFYQAASNGIRSKLPIVVFQDADGKEQRVQLRDGAGRRIRQGDRVPLLYDPSDPKKAVIDRPFFTIWKGVGLAFVAAVFLALGLLLALNPEAE